MPAPKPLPPVEELRRLFDYDPITGVLRWKNPPRGNPWRKGRVAGSLCEASGYWQLSIYNRTYRASRVVWKIVTGEEPLLIEHRDLNKANNAWLNLRLGTTAENSANTRMRGNNTSGFKGVGVTKTGRYVARIGYAGSSYHLGTYDTPEEANAAYLETATMLHGEFARAS